MTVEHQQQELCCHGVAVPLRAAADGQPGWRATEKLVAETYNQGESGLRIHWKSHRGVVTALCPEWGSDLDLHCGQLSRVDRMTVRTGWS